MERVGYLCGVIALAALTVWAFTGSERPDPGPTGVRVDPAGVYDPVLAGERLPHGFRQILPRDGIRPIYEPIFAAADQVDWPGATQVIGVSVGDEAKAYPVSFLNGREMVVDEIDGIPILVTW